MNTRTKKANVVLNFHRGDQASAEALLRLLLAVDEGIECTYYLQYGHVAGSLASTATLLEFLSAKDAVFSTELPAIKIPSEMTDHDPNLERYEGNQAYRTKGQKQSILGWNLCVYKHLQLLDHFLLIEPDCVVLKEGWLRDIYAAADEDPWPIFGHLKRGNVAGKSVPTHWAGCSLYNSLLLRELPIETYFYQRYDNPWWPLRNLAGSENANNAFYGPAFSSYDVSFDYFLFAIFWRERTGSNDPRDWPSDEIDSHTDLIYCDFRSRLSAEEIIDTYEDRLCLFHGAKDDAIRHLALQRRSFASASTAPFATELPRSGPVGHPLLEEFKHLNLEDLANSCQGERCYIIGNGPSLNKTDLSRLKNEFTIGTNRIYLNFDKMGYQTTFHCSVNPFVIRQFADDIDQVKSIKFLRAETRNDLKNHFNSHFMESAGIHDFIQDLQRNRWCEGWTVTYAAMQLAYYLGFETVILVGVDHFFKDTGQPNKLVSAGDVDQNHFHPDYFAKGVKWQYPDLQRSERSYLEARNTYEADRRVIVDATVGGHLALFPKVSFESTVEDRQEYNYVALTQEADAAAQSGDNETAFALLSRVLVLNPSYAPAHRIKGCLHWLCDEPKGALSHLTQALTLSPACPQTTLDCATVLSAMGDVPSSLRLCQSYLKNHPEQVEIQAFVREHANVGGFQQPGVRG